MISICLLNYSLSFSMPMTQRYFIHNKNIQSLFNIVNSNLISMSQYFAANKLSINHSKCSFILFASPQRLRFVDSAPYKISIDNHDIPSVQSVKFLGVYLDTGLTWKRHITETESKISKSLGIIFRLSSFIPPNVLRILYCSLILPYLSYCNIVWGNTYLSNLDKLHILKKKAIRIISGVPSRSHSSPLFSNLNLLKLSDINLVQQCLFVYSAIHSILPNHLSNMFILNYSIHDYRTRSSIDIHIPNHTTNYFQHNIRFSGPKTWNSLPPSVSKIVSSKSFSNKLKKHLISNY